MITVFVQFKLQDPLSPDAAKALFQSTADRYRGMNGLVRKYYLHDVENNAAGGCYLFESRATAEAAFNAEWRNLVKQKYGADPEIRFFETPVIVDNSIGDERQAQAS